MDVPKITTDCPDCKPLLEQQQAIIDMLVKQVELLTARLEKVEREGKRQAAPFRKKRKADPKKPGRESGDDCVTNARQLPSASTLPNVLLQ